MIAPVFLYGVLATHRRGKVLQEALSASPTQDLPNGQAIVVAFGDCFQASEAGQQATMIDWTRATGHLLLLVPPFAVGKCDRPVPWCVERLATPPRGGEGIAKILATEVAYRLTGKLQTPSMAGATWNDLSVCIGTYRLHPAAGLFAVTCLPLWSLAVLDDPHEAETWLECLAGLAGDAGPVKAPEAPVLQPDHYGFLVFLLSQPFDNEEQMFGGLQSSRIFCFSIERSRSLLMELRERKLVVGVEPTLEAQALVMQSPYAPYVIAAREVSR